MDENYGSQNNDGGVGSNNGETEYNWDFEQYENIKSDKKTKKSKKKNKGLIVFGCIVGVLIIIGLTITGTFLVSKSFFENQRVQQQTSDNGATLENKGNLMLRDRPKTVERESGYDGQLTTEEIVEKVSPSVVGIVGYSNTGSFYTAKQNEGSGIIMSEDGYIITNAHVIEGIDAIKVVLSNGEEYVADVIGSDVDTDLAVIKIEEENLSYAEFGDSREVKVGEKAIAIGNPSGLTLAGSTTQGIISAKNRQITTQSGVMVNCLQTDAAINPGNSGGALVNGYGQVIGITSSKIVAEGFEGIGFAIPTAEAEPIVNDIIEHGYVKGRVRLGVSLQAVDEILAKMNGVPVGVRVAQVEIGSPAAKGGVVPNDIITEINGIRVTSYQEIKAELAQFKPGDKITLTVFRRTSGYKDRTLKLDVILTEVTPGR